jgi:hypothetical protein
VACVDSRRAADASLDRSLVQPETGASIKKRRSSQVLLDVMKRNRITYLIAAIAVVILGLSSRRYSRVLPEFVASYAGDTLWALTAFLGIGMLSPRWSTLRICVTALLFAFAIELSQLYHSPWVEQIRHTRVGGLILGYGFLWGDLLCYVIGIAVGCILEMLLKGLMTRRYEAGSVT